MTTVVPLASKLRSTRCVICEQQPPTFQVGPHLRACDECVCHAIRAAWQEADGFCPPLVSPIGAFLPVGGAS